MLEDSHDAGSSRRTRATTFPASTDSVTSDQDDRFVKRHAFEGYEWAIHRQVWAGEVGFP